MAVISRDRTRATWLTGAAGLLLLGVAIVMMVLAAPQAHPLPQHAAAQAPALTATQAGAYPPSMVTESWLAGRAAPRPNGAQR